MTETEKTFPSLPADATPRLNAALAKAQGQIENAKKDVANPFFNTKYADLAGIFDACRKPLADNGLAVVQLVANDDRGVTVTTRLLHESGESISSPCWVPVVKKDPQGYGSAMTYARRFGLQALVGVAAEVDDDGNSHADPKAKTAADYTKKPKTPDLQVVNKLVAAFAGLGVQVAQLEDRIGKPIAEVTEADIASLREYHKKKKELATETADQLAARMEAAKAEAGIAAEAAVKAGKDPRFAVFESIIDRIRAAKSSAEVVLIEAEAAQMKILPEGDKKALARSAADRRLVLDDAVKFPKGRKLVIEPHADVPL